MNGAMPAWIDPVYDEELEVADVPTAETVAAALERHPDAKAVVIFTPSYYGTAADLRAMAEACHARDVPLVTDDAWGLDYALSGHPQLPEGALAQGADLAIGSVQKTLTGLGQTSVLSVGSERIDSERLQLCFELEKSTSASTVLLSSIDGARRQFVRDGEELLDRAITTARHLRRRLALEVPELNVVTEEELLRPRRRRRRPDALAHRDMAGRPHGVRGRRLDSRRAPGRHRARRPPPDPAARHVRARTRGCRPARRCTARPRRRGGDPRQGRAPRPSQRGRSFAPSRSWRRGRSRQFERVAAAGGYLEAAVDPSLDRLRVVA
jgi:hypothetical protein